MSQTQRAGQNSVMSPLIRMTINEAPVGKVRLGRPTRRFSILAATIARWLLVEDAGDALSASHHRIAGADAD